MKRTVLLLGAVVSLVPAKVAMPADDAQTGLNSIDLSGQWMSNFGPVTLKQDGLSVVGSFTEGTQRVRDAYIRGKSISADQWNGERGSITNGTIDTTKKTFMFKFHEAQSQLDGNVALTLSSDGALWEGSYSSSGMGGNRNGTWSMWRNKCGAAKYLVAC